METKTLNVINDSVYKISNKVENGYYSFPLPDCINIEEGYILETKVIKHIYSLLVHMSLNPNVCSNAITEEEINTILKILKEKTDMNFIGRILDPIKDVLEPKEETYKYLSVIGNKTRVTTKELEFSTPIPDNVTVSDGFLIKTTTLCKVVSILNTAMYYITDTHLCDQIKKAVKELNSQFFELEEEETSKNNKEEPYKSASEKVDADCMDIFNFVEAKFREIYEYIGFKNEAKMKLSISDKKQKVVFGDRKFNGYKLNIEAKVGGEDK